MKGLTIAVFIFLVFTSVVGTFFAYKAFRLRDEVKTWKTYHDEILAKLNILQKDYAGLSTYYTANEKLLSETTPQQRKEMTILFGASITQRWDIEKTLPDKGLINRGIGSQSDTQLLARFSTDVLQLEPGQVVIKICAGNFQPETDHNMIWDEFEMMARIAESRGIRPILATIVPVTRDAEVFDNYSVTSEIKAFNRKIMGLGSKSDYAVIDYFKAMADEESYMPDNIARDPIHPNNKGYEIMAAALSSTLNRLSGR